MSFKAAALELAKRGFRVFPLRPGDKRPLRVGWQADATSDVLDILDSFPEGYNPGVACGEDITVIDVDAHKGGLDAIPGLNLPPTYTVRTPNGGLHFYFRTPRGQVFANSASKLAPGVDVRGRGGLAAGVGATFEGKVYRLERDLPVAELPAHLLPLLKRAPERATDRPRAVGDLDMPAAIQRARDYLENEAPRDVQPGTRGWTAIQVANRIGDFGVSLEMALELMEPWNEIHGGAQSEEEFRKSVEHAYRYRQDPVGRDNPTAGFDAVEHPKGVLFKDRVRWYDGTLATEAKIPPRPWLVEGRLIRKAVTVLGAPGSAGKSLWSLQVAVAVAIAETHPDKARELIGIPVKASTKVLVINNEDPEDELDRRLAAVMTKFDVPREAIHGRLVTYSGVVKKFKVARKDPKGSIVVGNEVAEMREFLKTEAIGLLVLDPLVSIHTSEESNNTEMQAVMEVLTGTAADCDASSLVIHHVTKPQQASAEQYAGNVNAIRGASAIKDAARVALTMFGMSKKDGEAFGVPAPHRHRYVRLDDAKANLHLATAEAQWFYKESVKIANDEWLGVLKPVDMRKQVGEKVSAAMALLSLIVPEDGIAITKAAEALIARAPEFREYSVESVKSLLLMGFEDGPYVAGGTTYTFERSGEAGGRISFK